MWNWLKWADKKISQRTRTDPSNEFEKQDLDRIHSVWSYSVVVNVVSCWLTIINFKGKLLNSWRIIKITNTWQPVFVSSLQLTRQTKRGRSESDMRRVAFPFLLLSVVLLIWEQQQVWNNWLCSHHVFYSFSCIYVILGLNFHSKVTRWLIFSFPSQDIFYK